MMYNIMFFLCVFESKEKKFLIFNFYVCSGRKSNQLILQTFNVPKVKMHDTCSIIFKIILTENSSNLGVYWNV